MWRDDQSMEGSTSMPLLADLLDDTELDMIFLANDGTIYHFVSNRRVPAGSILWGQKFGASTNISALATDGPSASRYTLQIIASMLFMLGGVIGNVFYHHRRRRLAKT
jgi:hypothetical protein